MVMMTPATTIAIAHSTKGTTTASASIATTPENDARRASGPRMSRTDTGNCRCARTHIHAMLYRAGSGSAQNTSSCTPTPRSRTATVTSSSSGDASSVDSATCAGSGSGAMRSMAHADVT